VIAEIKCGPHNLRVFYSPRYGSGSDPSTLDVHGVEVFRGDKSRALPLDAVGDVAGHLLCMHVDELFEAEKARGRT